MSSSKPAPAPGRAALPAMSGSVDYVLVLLLLSQPIATIRARPAKAAALRRSCRRCARRVPIWLCC
jgi:hypothetical protein